MLIRSVLFVGRRNAARSVMAEACFNAALIHGWRAFSGGWHVGNRIYQNTVQVLLANGFPADDLTSKPVEIFRQDGGPQIDICVFLDKILPADAGQYPGAREYWNVADPAGAADPKQAYAATIDEIICKISAMILSGRLAGEAVPLAIAS